MSKLKATIDEIIGLPDPGAAVADRPRSGKWPTVQRAFLAEHPTCAVCGSKDNLEAHHVLPFHLYPDRELDPTNLIPLCRGPLACHLLMGHLGDFSGFNPLVRADAEVWSFRLRARRVLLRLWRKQ